MCFMGAISGEGIPYGNLHWKWDEQSRRGGAELVDRESVQGGCKNDP